ncbi:MAG: accessory Sec system translocase SecA2 [Terriglobia bacterium]
MHRFIKALFPRVSADQDAIAIVNEFRIRFAAASDTELMETCRHSQDHNEVIAVAAVMAQRVLGLSMFDVQIHGALALIRGVIAEMQTGEGKTLVAVPAVCWFAKAGRGVHVMTVNDYLARRDSQWMGEIYRRLGFSVGCIQQGMSTVERKQAYACDITYTTANEAGFDYLRDQLALMPEDQVHRPFEAALLDEADSILIDEARIPLVIAGGETEEDSLAHRADAVVRGLHGGHDFTIGEHFRNVALTETGVRHAEVALGVPNLYVEENHDLLTAIQDALHAHALLRRDVDYIIKDGAIESVDEFKGRIAQDRRWPAGLHTAIEAKEGVALRTQGRILGSIALQNLIALYPLVCGMTGTAATQREELKQIYNLEVEVIPTNRPVIRADHRDTVFRTRHDKEAALLNEIRQTHMTGRPVLIGTASVSESERLSGLLADTPHQVLNARHEEYEAALIAAAGQRGAVTISTNMAGRGTDIALGDGVAEVGGLHVIGTNRHESRRIDNQLRGRAGRQGDPGSSRFLVSLEDDLVVRFGEDIERLGHTPESVQRISEGKNLEIRIFLKKYEGAMEGQRQMIQRHRQQVLTGGGPEFERVVALRTIDDLWSDHLAEATALRQGIQWIAWGGRDPLYEYLSQVDRMFEVLLDGMEDEIATGIEEGREQGINPMERGATWTYLTTDNPFGRLSDRIRKGIERRGAGWRHRN